MTESFVMTLGKDAMMMTLILSVPLLGIGLIIGLVISLFQALTQINETSLSFVPKLFGIGIMLALLGPWMLQQIVRYSARLFELLPQMVR